MVVSGEVFREGLQPSLSPVVQIYTVLKSSFVAVFADREAIADGLNPLTISARKPNRVQNQTKFRLIRTAFCIGSQELFQKRDTLVC